MEPVKKRRVVVLMGGPSLEHEVSLRSGKKVAGALDREKYDVRGVVIGKRGEWEVPALELAGMSDVAFIALHGTYGEDGTVQLVLEEVGLPYTGSDPLVSALVMNKYLSLRLLSDAGVAVPHSFLVARHEWQRDPHAVWHRMRHYLGFPFVVKPNDNGSSVGVHVIKNYEELAPAIRDIFTISRDALFQNYIHGREVTCAVVDHGWPESAFALLPTEIVPRVSHFFDYRAKYEEGGSHEITPARFPAPLLRMIERTAVQAHRLLGCRGFSRTDMIVAPNGVIYVLELNTIPGLTEQSLLPKAAEASGVGFERVLDIVIEGAFRGRR